MPENLQELNPEIFTYHNWSANWWGDLGLGYEEAMWAKNMLQVVKQYGVGYCDGSRLSFRPRTGYVAIMFEKDGFEFWCHMPEFVFEDEED